MTDAFRLGRELSGQGELTLLVRFFALGICLLPLPACHSRQTECPDQTTDKTPNEGLAAPFLLLVFALPQRDTRVDKALLSSIQLLRAFFSPAFRLYKPSPTE